MVIAAGFRCALTTDNGHNELSDDRFTLKRFSTGNSLAYTDVIASGLLQSLVALKSAMSPLRKSA